MSTAKYAWLTIKHKWFVFCAGWQLFHCLFLWPSLLWRLIIHDLSKFSPQELPHYGRQFFGTKDDPEGFIKCWVHHQNRNEHHWEYWIPRTGHNRCTPPYPDNEPIEMPFGAFFEMACDWIGASRAYIGLWPQRGNWPWLTKNFDKIRVHPKTREQLKMLLHRYLEN
jgi:hypothetical protein